MIGHRHISKFIAAAMALAVCACLFAITLIQGETETDTGITMEYETALFDTSQILTVNILMEEEQWEEMLENATAEEYYPCDVEINGQTFYQVGIRPKGNTSLSSIAKDPDTDRYSFKLEFDQYVDGQTCYGLDKLVLNNNYADATNMKEALIYDMYQFLDVDASLYNYAKLSVNGTDWGVYLALEAVEDSFLLRNYGTQSGALYKPDSMNVDGGGFRKGKQGADTLQMPQGTDLTEREGALSNAQREKSDKGATPTGGGGSRGGGADLNYSDDSLDSYSTIWEGAVTKTTDTDHTRVVTALKNISQGTELEQYMDIDNLLKYMAVHLFSVNQDSLSGSMAHNYYLYESNGKLNLLPWDYNLAFGGMGGGSDAQGVINEAIDDAFSSTTFFDTLMAEERYHSQYYADMERLVEEYVSGGGFDAFYQRVRGQIDALVETDPTAFYSYEEYLTAVETLYQVVKLRGESVAGQLDGTIPSTEEGQKNADSLIDGSGIDLSVMGTMNQGGGADRIPQSNGTEESDSEKSAPTLPTGTGETTQQAPPTQGKGAMPDNAGQGQFETEAPQAPDRRQETSSEGGVDTGAEEPSKRASDGMPSAEGGGSEQGSALLLYGGSFVLLVVVLIFALTYRRKPRKR